MYNNLAQQDAKLVSTLLRIYLCSLPEPILKFSNYDTVVKITKAGDQEATIKALKELVATLPKHERILTHVLMHLYNFMDKCNESMNVCILMETNCKRHPIWRL